MFIGYEYGGETGRWCSEHWGQKQIGIIYRVVMRVDREIDNMLDELGIDY